MERTHSARLNVGIVLGKTETGEVTCRSTISTSAEPTIATLVELGTCHYVYSVLVVKRTVEVSNNVVGLVEIT